MLFPLIFFSTCAVIALVLHLLHKYIIKKGLKSLLGRAEDLELTTNIKKSERKDTANRSLSHSSSGKRSARLRNFGTRSSEKIWVDHIRDNIDDDNDDDDNDDAKYGYE
mmetsp:Transcript_49998/g.50840  ORF Transcript_49998/g.50840 Transcript_49998/m.50840 type:complete len:109 (+) Transcript_49998:1-327(+)